MDDNARLLLARLIRDHRVASLGTLHDGEPLVSMILFAAEPDSGAFLLLASTLAQHTQDFLRDPRAGLMIAETDDDPTRDPQALGRVSILGRIEPISLDEDEAAHARYLGTFPHAQQLFQLGDFALYRFVPHAARFVAGFGRAYNLAPSHLRQATSAGP